MELLELGIITADVKVLAFLSCIEGEAGRVACGRGQLAMLGATGLQNWANRLDHVVEKMTRISPQDSSADSYSASLGAALHELCHALDLVHADQGIMARGYQDVGLFFTATDNRNAVSGRADFHRSGAVLLSGHP